MKCGSQDCTDLAVARWVALIEGLAAPTVVQGTFLLCQGHDEWYQTLRGYTCFRLGLLADEQCLHERGAA